MKRKHYFIIFALMLTTCSCTDSDSRKTGVSSELIMDTNSSENQDLMIDTNSEVKFNIGSIDEEITLTDAKIEELNVILSKITVTIEIENPKIKEGLPYFAIYYGSGKESRYMEFSADTFDSYTGYYVMIINGMDEEATTTWYRVYATQANNLLELIEKYQKEV